MQTITINRQQFDLTRYAVEAVRFVAKHGVCLLGAFEEGRGRYKRNDVAGDLYDAGNGRTDLKHFVQRVMADEARVGKYGPVAQKFANDHPRAHFVLVPTSTRKINLAVKKLGG
jgi:hypothetical protein